MTPAPKLMSGVVAPPALSTDSRFAGLPCVCMTSRVRVSAMLTKGWFSVATVVVLVRLSLTRSTRALVEVLRPTKTLAPSETMDGELDSPAARVASSTRVAGAARLTPHSLPPSMNSQKPGRELPKVRPRLV